MGVGAIILPNVPELPPRTNIKWFHVFLPKHAIHIAYRIVHHLVIYALVIRLDIPTLIEAEQLVHLTIGIVWRQVHIADLFIAQLILGQRTNHYCAIDLPFQFSPVSNERYDTVNNLLCQGTLDVTIILVLVLACQEMS
jgi:hypothetical protein